MQRVRDPLHAHREHTPHRPMHARLDGFDLHAAVAVAADDREGLESLCRYIARPAVAQASLELLDEDRVRAALRHPWRDGTTHLEFEPLELIGRLAAFVPRPRTNVTLYHGVLAPAMASPSAAGRDLLVSGRPGQRPRQPFLAGGASNTPAPTQANTMVSRSAPVGS